MKSRLILVLGMLLLPFALQAQRENNRGFFLEMTAGYGHEHYSIPEETYANLSPTVGYQFDEHWAAGFRMTFETRDYAFKIYTPFIRYNYLARPKWALFTEALWNRAKRDIDGGQCEYDEVGISLGGTYALSSHVRLVGRYLFVGYSTRKEREKAYVGKSDFLLDANIARLQAGVQVLF